MGHVFGRASFRYHFGVESAGKVHGFTAADPFAIAFGIRSQGAGFSLLPVTPATLTLVPSPTGIGTEWVGIPSPFNQGGWRAAFAPGLGAGAGRIVAAGNGDTDNLAYSDGGGTTWTGLGFPLGSVSAFPYGVAWAAAIGLFVIVGVDTADSIMATSADGITWGVPFDPFGFVGSYPTNVAANDAGDQLVAVTTGGNGIWTTTDATTWTPRASLFDGFDMQGVRFLNGKWYVAGNGGGGGAASFAVADPSDLSTWDPLQSPLDDGIGIDVGYWNGRLYIAGSANSGATEVYSSDDLGVTWSAEVTPLDGDGTLSAITGASNSIFVCGNTADDLFVVAESNAAGAWRTEDSPISIQAQGLLYVEELGTGLGRVFMLGGDGDPSVASKDGGSVPLILTPLYT